MRRSLLVLRAILGLGVVTVMAASKNPPPPPPLVALVDPTFDAVRDLSPSIQSEAVPPPLPPVVLADEEDLADTTVVVAVKTRKSSAKRRRRHRPRRRPKRTTATVSSQKDVSFVPPPPLMLKADQAKGFPPVPSQNVKNVQQYWTRLGKSAQPPSSVVPPVYVPANAHQFKFL